MHSDFSNPMRKRKSIYPNPVLSKHYDYIRFGCHMSKRNRSQKSFQFNRFFMPSGAEWNEFHNTIHFRLASLLTGKDWDKVTQT